MKPITFACEEKLAVPPERIAEQILDLGLWPGFRGYGPLPGIRAAEFEARTPEVVGTRIRVMDTDGSVHVEEIGRKPRFQHLHAHVCPMPFAKRGDVGQILTQVREKLRDASAASQRGKRERRLLLEERLVSGQLGQARGRTDKTPEHPRVRITAIASIILDGLVER